MSGKWLKEEDSYFTNHSDERLRSFVFQENGTTMLELTGPQVDKLVTELERVGFDVDYNDDGFFWMRWTSDDGQGGDVLRLHGEVCPLGENFTGPYGLIVKTTYEGKWVMEIAKKLRGAKINVISKYEQLKAKLNRW